MATRKRTVESRHADRLAALSGHIRASATVRYLDFLRESGMVDPLAGDTRPTHRPPLGLPARFAKPLDFALVRLPELPGLTIESDLCFDQPVPLAGGRRG